MTQLKPLDKFEMNRMAHARAQELDLPGSPAGRNGHQLLSNAARSVYGVNSWSALDVGRMKAIHDFMDRHQRLPVRGEIELRTQASPADSRTAA